MAIHSRTPGISRRQAIGLLGVGAGAGVVSIFGRDTDLLAAVMQRGRGAQPVTFPRGSIIRALNKDIDPATLTGSVLFHEHLSIHLIGVTQHYTDDVPMMVEEAKAALKDGVALIVDGGHDDMKRDLDALKRITTESGLPIVASGGYYQQRYYPDALKTKSAQQIADELVAEAKAKRFGAYGEIGQTGGVLTDDERKVFEAVGRAAAKNGLPIFTHNAYNGRRQTATPVPRDAALKQLDVLEAAGASPAHIVIGHVCCLDDAKAEIAQQIAKRGAFIGFDRVTLNTMPDADKVIMAMALIEAGYENNLLLSSDFYSQAALKSRGGPGLAQTATVFGPMLIKAGLPEATLHKILVDNPRRFLAFTPKN